MRRSVFIFLLPIVLLSGCNNSDVTNEEYSQFLTDEAGKYSLYAVAGGENQMPVEVLHENHHVTRIVNMDSPEQQRVPSEINEMPYYMVFDNEDKIYETDDKEESLEFVQGLED